MLPARRHVSYDQTSVLHEHGQYCWLTKRTWILYEEFSRDRNMIPRWSPMSILNMALLSIKLTEAD